MFENRQRAKQLIDFSGITHNGCRPTDLDFLIEYKDMALVVGEFKYSGKDTNIGQTIMLERAVIDGIRNRKDVLAFVADHYVDNTEQDVVAKDAIVRRYMISDASGWHEPRRQYTVGEMVETWLTIIDRKHGVNYGIVR